MRLRADQRLFLSYLALVAATVAALSFGVGWILRPHLTQMVAADLRRELMLGRALAARHAGLPPDSLADLLGALSARRVTLIAPDGTVTGDSDLSPQELRAVPNHSERPEVRRAMHGGVGMATRTSATLGSDHLYVAARTPDAGVLRLAVPLGEVHAAVARVQRSILGVGVVAALVAAFLSLGFSVAITRPLRRISAVARALAAGDLSRRVQIRRRDELGDLAEALDTLADELQRRLGQLEAERSEMRALIDAMAEAVLALGPDGRLRRANPAARQIFSLPPEPQGLPPENIGRRPEFLRLVSRSLGGQAVPPTELTHAGRQLLATAHPLADGGVVMVFLDVSELRRLEGVRRDFVANASHELKTPLTAIRGYSETLLDEALPPELARRFAEVVRGNAERLQHIVDDLLDLSRIESGGWRVEPEPIDVRQAAQEAWDDCGNSAGPKRITLEVDVDAAAATVMADRAALRQILINLFSNAIRYTPGGAVVAVRARPLPGRRGWAVLEVADTGAGIPAAHLPRIFERFYRVDPARSRAEGGTGLGLAIVKHMVEGHGGTVAAESTLGRGTTIRFTLPTIAEGAGVTP